MFWCCNQLPNPLLHCLACRGWEETTLMISYVSKGFPYKDQIEELFIAMVSFCVNPDP